MHIALIVDMGGKTATNQTFSPVKLHQERAKPRCWGDFSAKTAPIFSPKDILL